MMPTLTYELRDGFRIKGDPHAVGNRIVELKGRNATRENPEGTITPEEVLADARDPDSPLHAHFTWDVAKAAYQKQLEEAAYLIRCYRVRIVGTDAVPIFIDPANIRIRPPEKKPCFASTSFAMSDAELRAKILEDVRLTLARVQERLRRLEGLTPEVLRIVADLLAQIEAEATAARAKKRRRNPAVRPNA